MSLHNDKSNVDTSKVSNISEGAGKLFASLGKEVDEHDVVGKVGSAGALAIKLKAIGSFIIVILVVIFIAITGFMIFSGGNKKESSAHYDGTNKRIVSTDNIKQYQIKDSDGNWYIVDENTYNQN